MTIFKQWDSRWGYLPYPRKPKTLSTSGCGCCSVANVMVSEIFYNDITPKPIRKYMVGKGYAIYGNGTTRSGVANTLRHYGYTVTEPNVNASMNPAFKDLAQSTEKCGVILFKAGSRGGVTWTGGGHYVGFCNYKIKNGKHWFKMKDSGRNNDGWFNYEDHMRGLVVWVCICMEFKHSKIPQLVRTKDYSGVIPKPTLKRGNKNTRVRNWQKFLRWTFDTTKVSPDYIFGPITEKYTMYFQKRCGLVVDGIVGPKTIAKAKEFIKK